MIDHLLLANLLAFSAQAGVIAVIAIALPVVLRVDAAGVRYVYWRSALSVCLALPWLQPRMAMQTVAAAEPATISGGDVMAFQPAPSAAATADWAPVLIGVCVLGAALRLAWIVVGFVRLQRLRKYGTPSAGEYEGVCRELGVSADIRYVDGCQHPVTFGLLRPVILLPSTLHHQSPEIREAVVLHELFHVKRRDWVWVVAEESVRALCWFHPPLWLLISRVQSAREEVVDAAVVATTGRRRAYVEALMAFADTTPLAPATAFARRRHLFQRILLVSKENVMSARRLMGSAFVMLLVLGMTVWGGAKTFPLSVDAAAEQLRTTPGPLELSANQVSPENPVPRRLSHQTPNHPATAMPATARAALTLRMVLDATGTVAEVRVTEFRVTTEEFRFDVDGLATFNLDRFVQRATVRPGLENDKVRLAAVAKTIYDGLVETTAAAVSAWRYDAPVKAPIALDYTFFFAPSQVSESAAAIGAPPPPPPPPPGRAQGARVPGVVVPPPPLPPPPPGDNRQLDVPFEGIRVGGDIKQPTKTKDVRPVYPQDARDARIQGVVIIETRIDENGHVDRARVLRSIPQLDPAAIDAVRQWEFQPTLLNGVPKAVVMVVTVQFSLQ